MAFFSGQDTKTLNIEGNDTNCFVSLIVDTKGTYQAAITRKVKLKTEVITKTNGMSYEFFGDGSVQINNPSEYTKFFDEEVIQYFMLDVEVEQVDNPLNYLDTRFEEIEAKKKATVPQRVYVPSKGDTIPFPMAHVPSVRDEDGDGEFYDWLHSSRKESAEAKEALYSEPTLFDKETMDEMVVTSNWQPDPTIIHYLSCQLLTCSLIVNKDIDLKQWVKVHMEKKYDQIFSGANNVEFSNWADSYVEFIVNHYSDANVPEDVYDDLDTYQSKIAEALTDEISEYSNDYISEYMNVLSRFM